MQLLLVGRVEEDFIALLQLVDGEPSVIVENDKIDKIVFIKKYTPKKVTLHGGVPLELVRG